MIGLPDFIDEIGGMARPSVSTWIVGNPGKPWIPGFLRLNSTKNSFL